MEVSVVEERKDALYSRTVYELAITFDQATPSRMAVAKFISKKYGAELGRIIVKAINNEFGQKQGTATVYVYDDEATMKRIEKKIPELKEAPKEEPKEAAPAKEEAPAEEKKEEAPKEEAPAEEEAAPEEKKDAPKEEAPAEEEAAPEEKKE